LSIETNKNTMTSIILIKMNAPIYTTGDTLLDYWHVAQKCLPKQMTTGTLDEWQTKQTLMGKTVPEWLDAYDIKVWKWNLLKQNWVEQKFKK